MKSRTEGAASLGEMMLAKTILEEKNEMLDAKDREIASLTGQVRRLTGEVRALRGEADSAADRLSRAKPEGHREGVSEVVEAVVGILSQWGSDGPGLAARLLTLLRERWGLEVIDRVDGSIDPRQHRVLQVDRGGRAGARILEYGYRMNNRVLRPALVKVAVATDAPPVA